MNIGTFTTQLTILWYEKKSTPLALWRGMACCHSKNNVLDVKYDIFTE